MSNCVDCSCKQIEVGLTACKDLHELNDGAVSGSAKVFQYAQICDYPKLLPKAFYAIWCMFKNLIAQVCWLTEQVKQILADILAIKKDIDDLQKAYSNLCEIVSNIVTPKLKTILFTPTGKVERDTEWLTQTGTINDANAMRGIGVGIKWAKLERTSCDGKGTGFYEWLAPHVSWMKLKGVRPGDVVGTLTKAELKAQTGDGFSDNLWNQLLLYSSLHTAGLVTKGHVSTEFVIDVDPNYPNEIKLIYWGAESPIGGGTLNDSLTANSSNQPRIFITN